MVQLSMSKAHFGLIGLGVMGENLVLNAERNGFSSVVYNRTYSKTEEFMSGRGAGKNIQAAMLPTLDRARQALEAELNAVTIANIADTIAEKGRFTIPWEG